MPVGPVRVWAFAWRRVGSLPWRSSQCWSSRGPTQRACTCSAATSISWCQRARHTRGGDPCDCGLSSATPLGTWDDDRRRGRRRGELKNQLKFYINVTALKFTGLSLFSCSWYVNLYFDWESWLCGQRVSAAEFEKHRRQNGVPHGPTSFVKIMSLISLSGHKWIDSRLSSSRINYIT